jgi:hypothetical protein
MNLVINVNTGKSVPVQKHYSIKTFERVEVKLHAFITSAVDGGE